MDDLISRQAAIDICRAPHMRNADCSDFEMAIMMLPPANNSEIPNSSDTISRKAAIDALHMHLMYRMGTDSNKKRLDEWINNLPSAQPVQCEDAVSRETILKFFDDWMSVLDENCHNQSVSDLKIIKRDFANLPPVTPKQRTGKWIRLDMHAHLADHKCTACEQECYVPTCMGEPIYAFCPNCGADMREVTT